jgi:Microtubule-binding protein MIP-T3 CH-like domain
MQVTHQGALSSPRQSGKDGSTATHCPPFDKAALSLWRQFNDKIQATRCEVGTWMTLQNNVLDSITQLSGAINCAVDVMQNSTDPVSDADNAESDEMLQGLHMLSRQVNEKLTKCISILGDTRKKLANFSMMGGEMKSTLCDYEELIAEYMKEEQVILTSPRSKGSGRAASSSGKAQEMCALVDRMRKCGRQLTFTSSTMTSPVASRDGGSSASKQKRDSPAEILSDYTVDYMEGSLLEMHSADTTRQLRRAHNSRSNVMADRNTFWVLEAKDVDSVNKTTVQPFLQVNLRQQVEAVSIILQGGFSPSAPTNPLKSGDVTLSCGVNIENSTGDVSLTSAALGSVISWTALLKKTPPEKFLQRPPIRFLFDLFVYCAKEFPDLFPESLRSADWSVVSESKKSKLDFMDIMIGFLSSYLEVNAPTTASSIVSGLDAEFTNVLLQHLAIAIHLCKMRQASEQTAPAAGVCDSWPTAVHIAVSADGVKWLPGNSPTSKPYSTSLTDAEGKVELKLDFPNIAAKFLRVYPVDWSSPAGSSSISCDIRSSFAVRVSIRAKALPSSSEKPARAADYRASSLGLSETELGDSDRILASLTALQDMALVIIAAIAFLSEAEKVRKARKQEELRKVGVLLSAIFTDCTRGHCTCRVGIERSFSVAHFISIQAETIPTL